MKTVGVLLANGQSKRFGKANKLLAPFKGSPLISHAANALSALDLQHYLAVTQNNGIVELLSGYEIITSENSQIEQGDSVRIGVKRALEIGADRVLIILADMPFITSKILEQVLEKSSHDHASAVTDGERRMPPACFPAKNFAQLIDLSGDKGAAHLLKAILQQNLVQVPKDILVDIDTLEDLKKAELLSNQ